MTENEITPTMTTVAKATASQLTDWLHPNVVELIRVAPQSPIVRGFIMSKVGLLPPDELATFEQLKDWIEAMEKPKVLPKTPSAQPVPRSDFTAEFDHSRTVFGTCHYRMPETGSNEVGVTLQDLGEWIEDGKTVDEIIQEMAEKAQEDGPGDWCGDDENTSYDEYELEELRDEQTNLSSSREQFTRLLRQYLQDYDPELLEALDNNG